MWSAFGVFPGCAPVHRKQRFRVNLFSNLNEMFVFDKKKTRLEDTKLV